MTPPPLEQRRETTRRGYWIALVLVVAAVAVTGVALWRTYAAVAAMPRIEARGQHTVDLPAGELVVFGEVTAPTADGSVRCAANDAAGSPLTLSTPGSTTSYDLGRYHGRSVFELAVRASGPVTITCETDPDLVLAFGSGLGATIVIAVAALMLGMISASIVFFVTFVRRRRQKRLARDGQLVSGP
ncbi:MAG TPA: hypothetical protein VLT45_23935 [Kofleriaceae bacterium]|nr:hypothetical protein [Kofleriaceae bacterium]